MDYEEFESGQSKEIFWYKSKKNLVKVLMKKTCDNKKNLKILNLGVGTGDDLEILRRWGENYVIDINKKVLSLINDELVKEKKIGDACNLPYKDNFFDVVVSLDVFEHIKDDNKAANEVYRVLKNDGVLIFSVPSFQFLFSSHDKALNHERRYNKKTLYMLLPNFNLKVFYWNSFLFIPFVVNRLIKRNSKPKVDKMNLPDWLNNLFYHLLNIENYLIEKDMSMPIGLSLVGYGFKKK
ncbi:MAG: class I SAM-dependent methyltransferase [Candidatus Woesearchaeota archaeon]